MNIVFYGNENDTKAVKIKKNIFNKFKVEEEYSFDKIFSINLKNKNINVLVEGEELFIKVISIPKVKKNQISSLVKNEVTLRYGDKVMFKYSVLEEKDNIFKIILYCFHEKKYSLLNDKRIGYSRNLKVEFLQNYVLKYYSKYIQEEKYKMIFQYKNFIYFIKVNKENLLFNKVMKITDTEKINKLLDEFIKDNKTIYHFNSNNIEKLTKGKNVVELLPLTVDQVIKFAIAR
ncbi:MULTISPECIES: hypothetical protein [Clostridium]|uniref:Uncharacterized protein n=1 Tax=Clostridium senegalense TaxID=1465809 RepID=A0A6M0GYP0_9CLOT|nr:MULTISPECIES: hypothetical protein [Clostridium]NEU03565.1 hypothetical protein [Clostridium senegalense]